MIEGKAPRPHIASDPNYYEEGEADFVAGLEWERLKKLVELSDLLPS
jgi:hypothetical protein